MFIITTGLTLLVSNTSAPIKREIVDVETPYSLLKKEILAIKSDSRTQHLDNDSLSALVTDALVNKLIPCWLGTPWSFEGHTSIPRQGEIACGYFVSTTLRDAGFNLNRYKFAQQLPVNEGKTLSLGKPLIEIFSTSTAERIEALQDTLSEGIYFIGFDRSHVGYIHKKGDELFIIHSNYIGARGVEIERIEESDVFSYYDRIYIAEISTSNELMKKWKDNEVIDNRTE
jgi:hypothetical protein